jgi:hypothetical protein
MRLTCSGLMVLLCLFASVGALGQDASAGVGTDNLSAQRSFGLGVEAEYPWGGLISARYWATSSLGLEGVFFVLSDAGETSGVVTARVLYRAVDAANVDFYVAGGASAYLSALGTDPAIGILVGGIEVSFSERFAWNVEFGLSATIYGKVWTAFGTGIHFYF